MGTHALPMLFPVQGSSCSSAQRLWVSRVAACLSAACTAAQMGSALVDAIQRGPRPESGEDRATFQSWGRLVFRSSMGRSYFCGRFCCKWLFWRGALWVCVSPGTLRPPTTSAMRGWLKVAWAMRPSDACVCNCVPYRFAPHPHVIMGWFLNSKWGVTITAGG